ncbi:MAG: hypothetical protein ABI760_00445 [Ferruginibacter sp.]
MKTVLNFTCIFFLCISSVFAQKAETIRVVGKEADDFIAKAAYKFPAFTRARVYLKNGDIANGKFNYDYFNESMKYIDEKGDTLVIANEKDINCISIGSDTFFYDNRYFEWVASSASARLAVKRTLRLTHREKLAPSITNSPTNKVESHDVILDISNHQLDANEVLVFLKQTTYYISSINGHFAEANKKNIGKLFPGKNIEEYITRNKLNLNKEEDLIDVFVYANKPQ